MSCDPATTVPGSEGGHVKLADGSCCGVCMTISASLSGYVQDSNACGACAGHTSECQMNVSSSASDDGTGTNKCCPDPGTDCSHGFYGGYGCDLTTCNFDGSYHCGNIICAAATGPAEDGAEVSCDSGPTTYKISDCKGGYSPCGETCESDGDCPPSLSPCLAEHLCAPGCFGFPCVSGLCSGGPLNGTACRSCTTDSDCPNARTCSGGHCTGCALGHCTGGECYGDCPCASDTCPDYPDFVNNSFGVIGYIHKNTEEDWLDEFGPGYYISIWVLFELGCGLGFQVRRDFSDNGIVLFISDLASNPSGTTHTFDFTDPDFGVDSCGLEGISYEVVINIGNVP